jgi:TonB-linked SusC/RagA family outer membrane protein
MKKVFRLERFSLFLLKFDLKMKLTTLLLLVSLFQLQANVVNPAKTTEVITDNLDDKAIIQENIITGTIKGIKGIPFPGINIIIEGTSTGTQTDFDGRYSINAKEGDVLLFSFVGFKSQQITVGDSNTIDLVMEEEAGVLDEVVVIGYGTKKKSNLTAAVEMVDQKLLINRPVRTAGEMLEGAVPGLNVSVTSGAPDATPDFNIRGFTGFGSSQQPLILVDGVEQNINTLNPNDVESVSVLKDAAASAIYGSRAPFGVILFTTKKGSKDSPMRINYSTTLQFNSPFKLPSTQNSYDFAVEMNRAWNNSGQPQFYSDETLGGIQAFINGTGPNNIKNSNGQWGAHRDATSNTDYVGEAFKNSSVNLTHDLSIIGGSEKSSYYVGLGYNGREGIYATDLDNNSRYNVTIKFDTDIKEWLNFGMNVRYTKTEAERPNYNGATSNGDGSEGSTTNSDDNFWNSVSYFPNIPIKNPDGNFHWLSAFPVLEGLQGSVEQLGNELWITPTLTIKPTKNLVAKIQYSRNFTNGENLSTTKEVMVDQGDGSLRRSARSEAFDDLTRSDSRREYYQFDANLEYKNSFGNHNFSVLVGGQQEFNEFKSLRANRRDLFSVDFPVLSNAFGDTFSLTEDYNQWATRGFYGRISYNYKSIYLLDINSRYDASSRYKKDIRWAYFPSLSAGYNIAKENYWPIKDIVNTFKITGSWGKLGNQGTGTSNAALYTYSPVFGTGKTTAILEGGQQPYVTPSGIVSESLTWEKPESIGFGIELGLFNNRLTGNYSWYQRTVKDQLGPAEQLPLVLGTAVPRLNNASSETRGWELSVGWRDNIGGYGKNSLHYSIRGSLSDYKGYVVEYGPGNLSGSRSNGWTPGQVFNEIYGYRVQGIAQNVNDLGNWTPNNTNFQHEGNLFFKDLDGDGLINDGQGEAFYARGDTELLGYSYPRFKYNVILDLEWKNFSFSLFLDGVGKEERFVGNNRALGHASGNWPGRTAYDLHGELGYWNTENRDAFFPRTFQGGTLATTPNDKYLLNLANLRIKNISLSYKLPYELLSADISFNFNIENVGFIYNKSWLDMDPILLRRGVTGYPTSRVISFGANFGF